MDFLSLGLAAVLGSALTALGFAFVLRARGRRRNPSTSKIVWQALEGVWVEYIPEAAGRSISVGRIYYDRRHDRIAFDGTNYTDRLLPYCYWTTYSSSCQENDGFYSYMFRAVLHSDLDKVYHGNGVVFFSASDDAASVENGYYVSVSVDAQQMSHSMLKVPLLQHKNAYKKAFSPGELETILRNAGVRIPLQPANQAEELPQHQYDAAS